MCCLEMGFWVLWKVDRSVLREGLSGSGASHHATACNIRFRALGVYRVLGLGFWGLRF